MDQKSSKTFVHLLWLTALFFEVPCLAHYNFIFNSLFTRAFIVAFPAHSNQLRIESNQYVPENVADEETIVICEVCHVNMPLGMVMVV